MDNPNIEIKETTFGKGLFAVADIQAGEVVAEFDGDTFECEKASDLPEANKNHAIQFEEHRWRDSNGIARYINHSCEPNCGMQGLFTIVAMKDIKAGQELLWDYDMTEDSDWRMECQCGASTCRHTVGSFTNVPEEIRKKYKGYISDWLVEKYGLGK